MEKISSSSGDGLRNIKRSREMSQEDDFTAQTLKDRFADTEAIPLMDEQQDYELTGFQESDRTTLLKFKRKFDTCDTRDRKLEEGSTNIVFAYHSEDPVSLTEIKQHEFRGSRSISLLNRMDKRIVDETGWRKFDFTVKNVTIPTKETTYWCTLLKGPDLKSKHHITKVVPNIQKGNEGIVHHFVVYECNGSFNESDFDQGAECSDDNPDVPYLKCRFSTVVTTWAKGRDGYYFPSHVGFPIGASDSPKNFLLEVHYDNRLGIEGQRDSSGPSIYYTDKLRKYDCGIAAVGITVASWFIIPPKQKNWLSVGYCMHQCTEGMLNSTGLPGGGINVFASVLHTHSAGRATWTKHVRNGKELPEIARDDHYEYNYRATQFLRKEINIQPGDDLIHYCKYNTMDRDQLTMGGPSSRDEMCFNFLLYYPKIPSFPFCETITFIPSFRLVDKYFRNVKRTKGSRGNPLVKMDIKWTDEMATDLRKYQSQVKTVIPGCWLDNIKTRVDIQNPKYRVPVPNITEPLPPGKTCQVTQSPAAASCAQSAASCALFVGVLYLVIGVLK